MTMMMSKITTAENKDAAKMTTTMKIIVIHVEDPDHHADVTTRNNLKVLNFHIYPFRRVSFSTQFLITTEVILTSVTMEDTVVTEMILMDRLANPVEVSSLTSTEIQEVSALPGMAWVFAALMSQKLTRTLLTHITTAK